MKLQEFQSKKIFKEHNIPVPDGIAAGNVKTAICNLKKFKKYPLVIKAQVLAGGRGKAGGIKIAKNKKEAEKYIKSILGMNLITHQTSAQGIKVRKILIEECADLLKEYYFGMLIDRSKKDICIIVSSAGGMEIEEIAKEKPEEIIKINIDPNIGLRAFHIFDLIKSLKLTKETQQGFANIIKRLYNLFIAIDASLVEINPFGLLKDNTWLAIDAKILLDDNSLFRHPNLEKLRDVYEEDELERLARIKKVNYVRLDGNIGCMVNGAGLAMCTMDLIKHYGASPANFLDIGGGAKAEQVTEALKIIVKDPKVKGILINIFGGIVRCDEVAKGFVEALKTLKLDLPVVIRLTGTNQDIGINILKEQKIAVFSEMDDALKEIVKKVKL
ncbi:MAG: ADP-forming succinate--CoA ligase subunit beta [Candidatus Hydrogenedentota bacterium]